MLMKDKIIEKLSNESKGLSLIEINDLLNYDLAPADIPLAKDVMERYK